MGSSGRWTDEPTTTQDEFGFAFFPTEQQSQGTSGTTTQHLRPLSTKNDEIDSKLATTIVSGAVVSFHEPPQHILLFYKFHPLAKDHKTVELYRTALESLCCALELQGRILVGCNEHQSEGINGTLSGTIPATQAFVRAMTGPKGSTWGNESEQSFLETFWKDCEQFYQKAKCIPLLMDESEFKWSTCTKADLFPDLNIKIVKELIGTGGVLASIPLSDVQKGYLTPEEWHERMTQLEEDDNCKQDTVLIDCRNTKEWQIGHFPGAPDPNTTTFSQFPAWVQQNSQNLANKKVLMYCTGGIRCEKASAFIRNQVPSVQEVRHLQGGIHKYLDAFGTDPDQCLWKGKNFVFDGRGAQGASSRQEEGVVGKCLYCTNPYDVFQPGCVCTVCREPTLVCDRCRSCVREYHCHNHFHLRSCYFTDLSPYTKVQLESQVYRLREALTEISFGKRFKQKRKTLAKQCNKLAARIAELDGITEVIVDVETKCRNCGETGCSGSCWGFHGLKRKRILEEKKKHGENESYRPNKGSKVISAGETKGNNTNLQQRKALDRQLSIAELVELNLASPPSHGRDDSTGIRIPDTCTRELKTRVKGKWCKRTLASVLLDEFPELAEIDALRKVVEGRLLRVNDVVIGSMEAAEVLILKNMDVIGRIMHWHEPPVSIPNKNISVLKEALPRQVQEEFDLNENDTIFVCDKPSSIPVHPAGPYLSNSLTMMVEAQEGLAPKSLIPCHRIDRVTSGLTICCTNPKIAHLLQSRIESGFVTKYYLAKVQGRFPSCRSDIHVEHNDLAHWKWCDEAQGVEVNAPIETVDPMEGIRMITSHGKLSRSFFRLIAYDSDHDTSVVLCSPLTGRSHQLRVHLQWLGHSIVNDTLYGGALDASMDLRSGLVQAENFRTRKSHASSSRRGKISERDAEAAAKICSFCTAGPEEAFSPAQLLQGGHAICLHAIRYHIVFHSTTHAHSRECIGKTTLRVGPPSWTPNDIAALVNVFPFDSLDREGEDVKTLL